MGATRIALNATVYKACMNKTASLQKEAGFKDARAMWNLLRMFKATDKPAYLAAKASGQIKPVRDVLKELMRGWPAKALTTLKSPKTWWPAIKANPKTALGTALGLGAGTIGAAELYNALNTNNSNFGINAVAGGLTGLAAGGGLYAGLSAIPAMKRRKLLRTLVATAGGLGAAGLGAVAANSYQQNA